MPHNEDQVRAELYPSYEQKGETKAATESSRRIQDSRTGVTLACNFQARLESIIDRTKTPHFQPQWYNLNLRTYRGFDVVYSATVPLTPFMPSVAQFLNCETPWGP